MLLLLLLLSHLSRVRLCATPQMAAHQAPPSLGFSRQEYWSGLPFPFPGVKHLLLGRKAMTNLDRVFLKPRHHFAYKGSSSQSYGFSSSHVWM